MYAKKTFVGRKTLTELVPGPAFEPVNVYNMLQVIEENKSFKVCPTLSYPTQLMYSKLSPNEWNEYYLFFISRVGNNIELSNLNMLTSKKSLIHVIKYLRYIFDNQISQCISIFIEY